MGGGGRIVLSLMSGDVVLASCLNNHASFLLLFTKRVLFIYIYIYIYISKIIVFVADGVRGIMARCRES